jgi:membrane protein
MFSSGLFSAHNPFQFANRNRSGQIAHCCVPRFSPLHPLDRLTYLLPLLRCEQAPAGVVFKFVSSAIDRIKRIQEFLDEQKYVKQDHDKMSRSNRIAHFWALVVRSFVKNRAPVRASALAYTTLLALIPILALVVSVTSALIQKNDAQSAQTMQKLVDKLITTAAPQLNLMEKADPEQTAVKRATIVENIMSYVTSISSGKLGVTAGLALVFIAISVLSTVESTFNDIWGVTRGRTWFARIVQYWAAITLGPLFLITAIGLTTGSQFSAVQKWIEHAPFIGTFVVKMLPFVVLSLFLAAFYRLMPATKVRWEAALFGGMVGGCLLQLNNLFSVIYFSKVVTYSKIYGGLGVVPIFLVGLYFSWLILLFGAQVAYAWQNRVAYLQEKQAEIITQRSREFVALRIMTFIGEQFHAGKKPATRLAMSSILGIPSQLTAQIICTLVSAKLLIEVSGEEAGYTPARPLDKISVEDMLNALRAGSGNELATADGPERAMLREEYERILLAEMHTAGAISLNNLVLRASSLPRPLPAENHKEAAAA